MAKKLSTHETSGICRANWKEFEELEPTGQQGQPQEYCCTDVAMIHSCEARQKALFNKIIASYLGFSKKCKLIC